MRDPKVFPLLNKWRVGKSSEGHLNLEFINTVSQTSQGRDPVLPQMDLPPLKLFAVTTKANKNH